MRENSNVSIVGAAEYLKEHKSTLSKLENRKMKVNVEHLKAYSELLELPVVSFLPDAGSTHTDLSWQGG